MHGEPHAVRLGAAEHLIRFPERPMGRWRRWHVAALVAAVVLGGGLVVLGGALGWSDPLRGGLGACFGTFALGLLHGRLGTGGRSAAVLARRSGFSAFAVTWCRWAEWRAVQISGATGAALGMANGVDAPAVVVLVLAAVATMGSSILLSSIVLRTVLVAKALGLVKRLETTTLADLGRAGGQVELSLVVPPDAPVVDPPFVERRWAGVELSLEFGAARHSWPARLPVRDESGTGHLDLGAFELCGWRVASDVEVWIDDSPERAATWTPTLPPRVAAIAQAVGSPPASTNLQWDAWALAPGDRIYVVGDATEVRRGLGAYRGGSEATLGAASTLPAVAYLGDEADLRGALRRELATKPLVLLPTLALVAVMVAMIASHL